MHSVSFQGVRTHNLKNFNLTLEHRKFYVISGVSGSGKSSLAFDTLYAEGQRRYVESISAYARQFLEQMSKPDIAKAAGVLPAIAIQSKNTVSNARSTVGTQTEVNDFLRLLFSRLAVPTCSSCGDLPLGIEQRTPPNLADALFDADFEGQRVEIYFSVEIPKKMKVRDKKTFYEEMIRQGFDEVKHDGKVIELDNPKELSKLDTLRVKVDGLKCSKKNKARLIEGFEIAYDKGRGTLTLDIEDETYSFSRKGLVCSGCGKLFKKPMPHLFSFNSPMGACKDCQGFGRVITLDPNLIIPDENKSLKEGAVEPWTKDSTKWELGQLLDFCKRKKIPSTIPWKKLSARHKKWIWEGHGQDEYVGITGFFDYLQKKTYKMHVRIFLNRYRGYEPCSTCHGTRLTPDALSYEFRGKNIAEYQDLSIGNLHEMLKRFQLSQIERQKAGAVYDELVSRVSFLNDVGLHYLTLSRMSRTLSGGEVQRIHLASSLGSALVDTMYVLDEPSIGLHERDNQMLIQLLLKLRDLGNMVVVVEHDRTMIRAADEIIDLGPKGGEFGGQLIFQGPLSKLLKCDESATGRYLSGKEQIKRVKKTQVKGALKKIRVQGASSHNLKNCSADFPLNKFVVLTGVSGAGKSTLLYDIIYSNYQKYRGRPVSHDKLGEVKNIRGFEHIEDMVLIDQTSIGRSPRSNAASYLKVYDEIRKVFSKSPDAVRKKLGPGSFSFNTVGGRCEACQGDGQIKIEMHFLADVMIPCEECSGKRFKKEILDVYYRGKNIDQVLNMTIHEALVFFGDKPAVVRKLKLLEDVGLGYIKLGQSTLTLSGGEGQRLKLAGELGARRKDKMLYLFDEPTTGLHEKDISYLMASLEKLLEAGHSVLIIEHHLEMIRNADYIVDMGPEGGALGGEVIYQGDVEGLMQCKGSYTGEWLKKYVDETVLSCAV